MTRTLSTDDIIRKIDSFPTLPAIAARIVQVSSDPNTSVNDLRKIIEADSAIVMEIMKVANSPFFGLKRKVKTLEHCISLLGMMEIKNLVLAKAMFHTFRSIGGFDSAQLWRHSYYCAVASSELARYFGFNPDEFFVAGIIHDIGKLVIYMELGSEEVRRLESDRAINFDITQTEQTLTGISHDRLGMKLLKKWMFPGILLEAVGYHHSPAEAPGDSRYPMLVYLGDLLGHWVENHLEQDKNSLLEEKLFSNETMALSNRLDIPLTPSLLNSITADVRKALEEEQGILDMLTSNTPD